MSLCVVAHWSKICRSSERLRFLLLGCVSSGQSLSSSETLNTPASLSFLETTPKFEVFIAAFFKFAHMPTVSRWSRREFRWLQASVSERYCWILISVINMSLPLPIRSDLLQLRLHAPKKKLCWRHSRPHFLHYPLANVDNIPSWWASPAENVKSSFAM